MNSKQSCPLLQRGPPLSVSSQAVGSTANILEKIVQNQSFQFIRWAETRELWRIVSCQLLLLLSLLNCENPFYILCTRPLTSIFANIFVSLWVAFLLTVYFKVHKFLILVKSILSVFAIKVFPFCVLFKKSFTNPLLQRFFSPVFF